MCQVCAERLRLPACAGNATPKADLAYYLIRSRSCATQHILSAAAGAGQTSLDLATWLPLRLAKAAGRQYASACRPGQGSRWTVHI